MDLDMLDAPVSVAKTDTAATYARDITADTLRSLGYEVTDNEDDLTLVKGNVHYNLAVAFTGSQSGTYLRIPVDSNNTLRPHIFNMKADCIAFYQKEYKGGTIIQFKLDELKAIVEPVVKKLKAESFPAMSAANAIALKRIHADYCADDDGYDMYLYLPIEAICSRVKNKQQPVGKK